MSAQPPPPPPPPPPPSLLSIRSFHNLFQYAIAVFNDPRYFLPLAGIVLAGDALLTWLIISFVPYTEIDWETYIYQLELYMKGERDYALISGPTGPLVYPAGHVYVHRLLYALTNAGTNIKVAQYIFGSLYLLSVTFTIAIYRQAGGVPNWILLLLPLSKRLHSIYVLRLFNDCWSVVAAQAAILALARGNDTIGMLLLDAAVSVKMSALLYLPGVLVVLFKRSGAFSTALHVLLFILTQVAIGSEFLLAYPRPYLKYSYELGRVFLYKWTVNWRFVSEETFLSSTWARGLFIGQLATLLAFAAFKWCRKDDGAFAVVARGLRSPFKVPSPVIVTPDYVTTVLFTSNLIGILFARSLHYQFYSWYAHQLPFLAWRTRYPVPVKLLLLLGIEYAWNVFPSTSISSGVLLVSNTAILVGVWFGYPEGKDDGKVSLKED